MVYRVYSFSKFQNKGMFMCHPQVRNIKSLLSPAHRESFIKFYCVCFNILAHEKHSLQIFSNPEVIAPQFPFVDPALPGSVWVRRRLHSFIKSTTRKWHRTALRGSTKAGSSLCIAAHTIKSCDPLILKGAWTLPKHTRWMRAHTYTHSLPFLCYRRAAEFPCACNAQRSNKNSKTQHSAHSDIVYMSVKKAVVLVPNVLHIYCCYYERAGMQVSSHCILFPGCS
jgi:hypothetical protein